MPQETKVKPHSLDKCTAPEPGRPTLQGLVATRDDERALLGAMEQAFDYRGDVTLSLIDGRSVTGYIFDRRGGGSLRDSSVRLMAPGSDDKLTVPFDAIAKVEFSGRDAAHGKTFDNWVKRYVEKKLKGEKAGIECEALDDAPTASPESPKA